MSFQDDIRRIMSDAINLHPQFRKGMESRGKVQIHWLAEIPEHVAQELESLSEDEAVIRETQWMLLESDTRLELSFDQVSQVLEAFLRVLKNPATEGEESGDSNTEDDSGAARGEGEADQGAQAS